MLYILEQTVIGNMASWPGSGPPECRLYPTVTGPNPYGSQSLQELLSAPLTDVVEPLKSFVRPGDPQVTSIFRTNQVPELPALDTVRASIVRRTSNASAWRNRGNGAIIVSPMLRASLDLTDRYVVSEGFPIKKRFYQMINRLPVHTQVDCSNSVGLTPSGWQHLSVLPKEELVYTSVATLTAHYVGTDTPEAVRPLLGKRLSQAFADALLANIVARVSNLEYSPSMVTKTIADTRSGTYDILTDVVEAKSTFETIASCILRILRAYTDTKSRTRELGKLINARKSAGKKVADNVITDYNNQWLEFRYGITPIVLSLNSAIEWYNTRQHEYFKYRNITTTSHVIEVGSFRIELPVVTDRAFGKVRIDSSIGGLKLNPLSTALEVVPLSLLLNWVCNIGDCLSALWPPSGAKQEVYTVSRSIPKAMYPASFEGKDVHCSFGFYQASPISPEGNAHFQLELNVGWRRMLDAFALLYGPLKQLAVRK